MYNFIDLFCGAGGFAKGFEQTNQFRCIGAIDNKEDAVKTHKANFTFSYTLCDDIRNIDPSEFEKKLEGEVDVLIGGPPCPTFSTIGHAKIESINRPKGGCITEDPRNTLFLDYFRFVKHFRPKVFVMENVPQFLTKYKGQTFQRALEIISAELPEYNIASKKCILNSVNYGVPQNRRRMFLVGCLNGYEFQYPSITHWSKTSKFNIDPHDDEAQGNGLQPHVTVDMAISDLPSITDNWRVNECPYSRNSNLCEYQIKLRNKNIKTVKNNICRMSNDRAKRVFDHMKQGDIYMDLPKEVRQILPFREDIFKDRLKRLISDEPSWTVIAHIGMDGYMYIHPTECRTLSVREAARIQSFPDNFEFIGNQQETYVQVGNAVPPILAQAIAESVNNCLLKSISRGGGKLVGN